MQKQSKQQFKLRFFNDADHEKLKQLASKNDRTITYLINQAIKEFLSKESAKA